MRGRGLVAVVVVTALVLLSSGRLSVAAGPRSALATSSTLAAAGVALNAAVMKATHNAYAQSEPLFDQLVYHRIRSLELDIHSSRSGKAAPEGDWLVYHADLPLMRDTSCDHLSDCLGQIAAFHAAVPLHEIVSVFVDLKDDFTRGHSPAELDAALVSALGREALLTPADLLARCAGAATLREAVTGACGFPTLGELRGKILVAVTGGTSCNTRSPSSQYGAAASTAARVAFMAPNLDARCPIEHYDAQSDAIFFNVALGERHRVEGVRARGLMARLYDGLRGGLDAAADLAAAAQAGAQILATDRVNARADGWSTTASVHGGPFRCEGCANLAEPAALISARASSAGLEGRADSFFFVHQGRKHDEPHDVTRAEAWSAFVSVPSSHAEPGARACLMARAGEAPDAPHVALCRSLDGGAPTLVVRNHPGAAPVTTALGALPGLSAETPAFLRLGLTPAGSTTHVRGEVSADGRTWVPLAETSVGSSLPLRGIAVASTGRPAHALFGNLTRTDAVSSEALEAASLLQTPIGATAYGHATDGLSP